MAPHDYEKVQHAAAAAAADKSGSDSDTAVEYSGSEDERDASLQTPRTSVEKRRHDRDTLGAEEEAERLLAPGGRDEGDKGSRFGKLFGRRSDKAGQHGGGAKRRHRGSRRSLRAGGEKVPEDSELVYEMEEGPGSSGDSSGSSSIGSSEVDLLRLGETQQRTAASMLRKYGRFAALHCSIVVVFLVLVYGAVRASRARPLGSTYEPVTITNGSHTFLPTTILLSLDGFRPDFLHRNITPHFTEFLKHGLSPKYMVPSFPSLTFPNHFTIVTGLYPESHGIVGNNFWAPDQGREFYYTDPERSMQPEWWQAEPLWVRAEKAGVRSAVHMWPGSEAGIDDVELAWVDKYNGSEVLSRKVDRIMWWLDRPGPKYGPGRKTNDIAKGHERGTRPQFIAAYVPNVDSDGHRYGPNSTEVKGTIQSVDDMLGLLFRGLGDRNLTDVVNVVIVSDHGMATTDKSRLIQLEDLVNPDQIAHMDTWPLYGLRFHDESEENVLKIYKQIKLRSTQAGNINRFDVYLRDSHDGDGAMPERYHFTHNERIAPLWIVPRTGWAIVTKAEYNLALLDSDRHIGTQMASDRSYAPRGLHGYDNQDPLMRAVFAASGPAFSASNTGQPNAGGSELEPFANIEVYNMLCDSLGLSPQANNGTLRLPLRPVGKHSFPLALDLPEVDPMLNDDNAPEPTNGAQEGGEGQTDDETSAPDGQDHTDDPDSRPEIQDGEENAEKETKISWWLNWVHDKFDHVKDWAKSSFGGHSRTGHEDDDVDGGG